MPNLLSKLFGCWLGNIVIEQPSGKFIYFIIKALALFAIIIPHKKYAVCILLQDILSSNSIFIGTWKKFPLFIKRKKINWEDFPYNITSLVLKSQISLTFFFCGPIYSGTLIYPINDVGHSVLKNTSFSIELELTILALLQPEII